MMISNLLDISFFSGRSGTDAAGFSVAEDYVSDTYIVVRDSPCFLKLFSLFTLKALLSTPDIAQMIFAQRLNTILRTISHVI